MVGETRISFVGLQPDFDRVLLQLRRCDAQAPHVRANIEHLLLVDGEVHVNGSGLDNGRQLGRPVGSHQLPQRHTTRGDNAVEGGLNLGIAEVKRGLGSIDLCLLEAGSRGVAIGRCVIERLLRRDLTAREFGLPFELRFRLLQ